MMKRDAATAALAIAATTILSTAVQAEVTESSATHFVSRHAVEVSAAPKDTWIALIAPDGWWDDSHTWSADASNLTLTPQAGGCFCERIPAEDDSRIMGLQGSVQHMVVVQAVPRKVLRMRGALGPLQSEPVDGVLTITLQPIGEEDGPASGTRIVWEYVVGGSMRFDVPTIAAAVDGVIGRQSTGLANALGGAIGEQADDDGLTAFDDAFGGGGSGGDDKDDGSEPERFKPGRGR